MNILIIESSTDIELLAVESRGRIFQFVEKTGLSHSTRMFENIQAVLDTAGLKIGDIDLLGAGTGPGSFTGVRIAVSTARMLSQVLSIPLVGVKSHEIFAASYIQDSNGVIAVAFDAKKGRVFAGLYRASRELTPETLLEPGDYTMQELVSLIPENENLICIGDGFAKYAEVIKDFSSTSGLKYRIIDSFMPSGMAASSIVKSKFLKNPELYRDYSVTLPSYERLSDAENALDKKKY